MELESLDNSFDYGLEDEDFYESPPLKKPNQRRVTFNSQIYAKVRLHSFHNDVLCDTKQKAINVERAGILLFIKWVI